jgi:hypothetical protein
VAKRIRMTEKEFDDICCSQYHLAMIANRDGKYDHDRYGFYPIEGNYDIIIPVIERTPDYILGILGCELNMEPLWKKDVPMWAKVLPPLILGDTKSIDPETICLYIENSVASIKKQRRIA